MPADPVSTKSSRRAWRLGLPLGAALLALWVYWPALANAFLYSWDDNIYIITNSHIELTPDNAAWMLTALYPGNWHPLTLFSHAVDYALHGLHAGGHRLANLLLHSANTFWLFWIALALFNLRLSRPLLQAEPRPLVAAGIAAGLFALHPQHVEAVAWIGQRKEVLSLFFLLPALLAYLFYTRAHSQAARRYWFILALLCYIPAVLAKPMAVTFPAVLLLLDFYPLQRGATRRVLLEKLPFALIAGVAVLLTLVAQQGAMPGFEHFPLERRILNAFNSSLLYLHKFLAPIHLAPYYAYAPYRSLAENYGQLLPVFGFAAISGLALLAWQRGQRYWLAAWLFYLITLSPVIGLIQVGMQAAADRYAYVPTLPAYLLAGVGIAHFLFAPRRQRQIIAVAGLSAMLLLAALLTRDQIKLWRNDRSFWSYAMISAPNSPAVQCGLAEVFLQEGDYRSAIVYYRKALDQVMMPYCFYHYGMSYWQLGETEAARVVFELILSNQMPLDKEELADMHTRLATIYTQAGQPEKAAAHARQASELQQEKQHEP